MKKASLFVFLGFFASLSLLAQSKGDLFALGRALLKEDPFLLEEIKDPDIKLLGQAWLKQEPFFLLQTKNEDLKNLGLVILKKDSAYLSKIKDKIIASFGLAWLRSDLEPLRIYRNTAWYNLAQGLFKRDLFYLR